MHGFQKVAKFFSKRCIKNFPLITQFFDVPFVVYCREIAGIGHCRFLKFKILRGSRPPWKVHVSLKEGLA